MTWDPKDDIYKQFALTPDQQLVFWEDWIKIREHDVIKLGFRTIRPPADLAMNLIEKKRPDVERKVTLEECQIAAKPRVRGSLWEQAMRLKQYCTCDNVYEVQRTPAELGKPKIMQHILCPTYVQTHEKGLLGEPERVVCSKLNATYEEYRARREEELKDKIVKIDPYRPDMRELIIFGKRPKTPPKKIFLPEISISEPVSDDCHYVLSGVYALRVNNTITIKNIPGQDVKVLKNMQNEDWHENCYNWTYYFNVSEKRIGRAKMFLENLGTVALRYCWKRIKKVIPYIPEVPQQQNFYFNHNEDVIPPGQSKTIYFTFVCDNAGIFSQTWELALMNNYLFDNLNDKFTIHLVGDSVENARKISRKTEKLQSRIDKKATQKLVYSLINEMIDSAINVQHEIYPYKKWLLERELFVAKNIQHFYHQTEVHTLKEMYKQMTNEEWDLSLLTWRNAMMEKEFDDRMRYYDQLKKSHRILLTPWYEGDDLVTEKIRAVRLLLGQLMDKFYEEFVRVSEWNGVELKPWTKDANAVVSPIKEGPLTSDIVHNIFFIRMYDHVSAAMETIAGIVSSLELNRWIDFDFCQF